MILNRQKVQDKILKDISEEIEELKASPTLALLRVGDDFGSKSYEKSIFKILEPLGINVFTVKMDENVSQEEFMENLEILNDDDFVSGIMVFKPLPKHIDETKVNEAINPNKDVDSINPLNLGKLLINDTSGFTPCTPQAVIELLDYHSIDTAGKDVVIINRSNLFGKPLALMLTAKDATVNLCNSKTSDLEDHVKRADILITATGVSGLIKPEMLDNKMTVIDASVTTLKYSNGNAIKDENGKSIMSGDVTESCNEIAKNILSVTPNCGGGIGPLTTSVLAKNVLKAYKQGKEIGNNRK